MTYFRFQDPFWFLLLGLIPWMIYLHWQNPGGTLHYSAIGTLKALRPRRVDLLAAIPIVLRCLAVALLIFSLARPQEGRKSTEILSAGVDIILAIDTSGSMRALDLKKENTQVDRLTVVKDVVSEFIATRKFDRMGMVVFGQEAFTQCPLTLDHDVLNTFLDRLKIGVAGDSTAIGSAIGIAVKRLKDLKSKSKVIILLTDGRNNTGSITPFQAAEIAQIFGIKIYTVGVGTRGQAPFLVDSMFGQKLVYRDVELDETTLIKIADMTDGKYFRATDTDSLKKIYEEINRLEKSEVKWIDHSEFKELFLFFLIPSVALILLELMLSETRLRRIP